MTKPSETPRLWALRFLINQGGLPAPLALEDLSLTAFQYTGITETDIRTKHCALVGGGQCSWRIWN